MYDILDWHPHIAIGGIMAFHDYRGSNQQYGDMPLMSVEYAIDTLMNPPAYQPVGRNGSIVAFQKTGGQLLNPRFKKKRIPQSHAKIWGHLDDIFSHTDTVIICDWIFV